MALSPRMQALLLFSLFASLHQGMRTVSQGGLRIDHEPQDKTQTTEVWKGLETSLVRRHWHRKLPIRWPEHRGKTRSAGL